MSSNKKVLLISTIFGIISLILIIFVVFPLFKEIKKYSEEFVTTKKNIVFYSDETGSVSLIRKIYGEIEPDSKKIDSLFVDPEVPIDLIKFLERIAQDSKISVNITSVAPKTSEKDWNYMEFQINLIGSFPNLLIFLEKIENGPYLIETKNLSIKNLAEQEITLPKYKQFSLGGINANLTIKAFTKK